MRLPDFNTGEHVLKKILLVLFYRFIFRNTVLFNDTQARPGSAIIETTDCPCCNLATEIFEFRHPFTSSIYKRSSQQPPYPLRELLQHHRSSAVHQTIAYHDVYGMASAADSAAEKKRVVLFTPVSAPVLR